jgi:hypothetical protein
MLALRARGAAAASSDLWSPEPSDDKGRARLRYYCNLQICDLRPVTRGVTVSWAFVGNLSVLE